MKKNGELKGLVLDLRGNPGGLLDQAAKVADTFVADGPIVATVGNPSEGREEKVAHGEGTEPNYPLALLVNGSSASASEIVAGALKNHDRAVIIGETTFGKGSVQLVFTDLPDKAALKLTIAQYLTEPGDVSIQGVGVTPDIELDPMTVDPLEMDLTADIGRHQGARPSRALSNARAKEGGRPLEVVQVRPARSKERLELRERGGDLDENFAARLPDQVRARTSSRTCSRASAPTRCGRRRQFIADTRKAEVDKVADELQGHRRRLERRARRRGSRARRPTPPPGVDVKVETDRPNNEVTAGEPMNLKLTVTNHGTATLYRLFAVTKSDDPMFDNKELVIGKLEPGKSRTATAPAGWCEFKGHKVGSTRGAAEGRAARVPHPEGRAHARRRRQAPLRRGARPRPGRRGAARHGEVARAAGVRLLVRDRRQPQRATATGASQKGEGLTMYLTVKNVGKGRSFETHGQPAQPVGRGAAPPRRALRHLEHDAGRRRSAWRSRSTSSRRSPIRKRRCELSIHDEDLREGVVEKVRMPIADPLIVARSGGRDARRRRRAPTC